MRFLEENHMAFAIAPKVDFFDGDGKSDIYNLENFDHCTFFIDIAASTGSGAGTFVVNKLTSTTGAGRTAIGYDYRTSVSSGVWGAYTTAAAAGITSTTGVENQIVIEVDAIALGGSNYIELGTTEASNSPVSGCAMVMFNRPRYAGSTFSTVLT